MTSLLDALLTYRHSFEDAVNGKRENDNETPDRRQELLLLGGRVQHGLHLLHVLRLLLPVGRGRHARCVSCLLCCE